jgi:hypothetical protein
VAIADATIAFLTAARVASLVARIFFCWCEYRDAHLSGRCFAAPERHSRQIRELFPVEDAGKARRLFHINYKLYVVVI